MEIRVVHGKNTHRLKVRPTDTVLDIKRELERETRVAVAEQKLMLKKGQLKDNSAVFSECFQLQPKDKLMLIGNPPARDHYFPADNVTKTSHTQEVRVPSQAVAQIDEGSAWGANSTSTQLDGAEQALQTRLECIEAEFCSVLQLNHSAEASELLSALLASTGGVFSEAVLQSTVGLCCKCGYVEFAHGKKVATDAGGADLCAHEPLLLASPSAHPLNIEAPNGAACMVHAAFLPTEAGVYVVSDDGGDRMELELKPSPLALLCRNWDLLFDKVFWGWVGEWTPALHDAVCLVVLEADSGLEALRFGHQELAALHEVIVESAGNALDHHEPQSVNAGLDDCIDSSSIIMLLCRSDSCIKQFMTF